MKANMMNNAIISLALIVSLILTLVGCSSAGRKTSGSGNASGNTGGTGIPDQPDTGTGKNTGRDKPVGGSAAEVSVPAPSDIPLRDDNNLKNPNATYEARVLYNYICDIYKHYILSGQQESTWMGTPDYEMQHIREHSSRAPAIRGLDYINEDFDGVTQRAIKWWESGGIVSICWHWGTPPDGIGYDSSLGTIDPDEALTEGTNLYNGMIAQMDRVAEELKKLQDAGVPVLWRPFHEFDGAWFWWGKGGPDNFIRLWRLMYKRYTEHHGLNNLIWVLGYSDRIKDGWYPGDEYVDIIGSDNYKKGTHVKNYKKLTKIPGSELPAAYHENGPIPDPDQLIKDKAYWVWFLTWHTTHIKDQNTPEHINKVYNHGYVITLDELPDFREK
jgi:hypothetical protein